MQFQRKEAEDGHPYRRDYLRWVAVVHVAEKAMGCMPPSLHLHKLNPHILADDGVPMFLSTEHVPHRMNSAFVACTACGIGGSNAHAILWGRACARQVKMEKAVQAEEVLSFWPGGGGELDPACENVTSTTFSSKWHSVLDLPREDLQKVLLCRCTEDIMPFDMCSTL
ncbi:eryA [Symbiodinium natans]|uniref:EryA protein n=1 Tax=Symbiodinium natans TaxID=878477 RepID=A0A812PPQ0_9DINO|nr:eryA [Symbiodinium natans]